MQASNILGLDVGEKRVGVAMVRAEVRVPVTLDTLDREATDFWHQLIEITKQNNIGEVVIGLPRGLDGQETAQTALVRAFGQELTSHITLPAHWQDEALTSVQARNVLDASGKPYQKGDIDALAASIILTDYLDTQGVTA